MCLASRHTSGYPAVLTILHARAARATLLRRSTAVVCAIFVSAWGTSVEAQGGYARPNNSSIRGEISKLAAMASQFVSPACGVPTCRTRIPTTTLLITSPEHHSIQIQLREVRGRSETLDNATPLLFRGIARIRHMRDAGGSHARPIAATLYRRGSTPVLEIGLPGRQHKRRPTKGIVLVRALLEPMDQDRRAPAREQHASGYSFQRHLCGQERSAGAASSLQPEAARVSTKEGGAYRTVYLATDFDPEFATARRCATPSACNDTIVGLINQASLFYESQFGIQLEVARQFGPSSYPKTSSAYTLLSDFTNSNNEHRGEIVHDGRNSGENLVDLYQLYTGKGLSNFIIGLAYVETMCTNTLSGAADMLVSTLSAVIDPVTIAHEVGHTLGASHSDSGIMNASLGYPLPTSFTTDSREAITEHLKTHYGECRGGALQGYEEPPPSSLESAPRTIRLAVRHGKHDSYLFTTRLSHLSTGCSVTLRAAERASQALKGKTLTTFVPVGSSTSQRVRLAQRISAARAGDDEVFIAAQYSCPNGAVMEVSAPTRLKANGGSKSGRFISRRVWITRLSRAF